MRNFKNKNKSNCGDWRGVEKVPVYNLRIHTCSCPRGGSLLKLDNVSFRLICLPFFLAVLELGYFFLGGGKEIFFFWDGQGGK